MIIDKAKFLALTAAIATASAVACSSTDAPAPQTKGSAGSGGSSSPAGAAGAQQNLAGSAGVTNGGMGGEGTLSAGTGGLGLAGSNGGTLINCAAITNTSCQVYCNNALKYMVPSAATAAFTCLIADSGVEGCSTGNTCIQSALQGTPFTSASEGLCPSLACAAVEGLNCSDVVAGLNTAGFAQAQLNCSGEGAACTGGFIQACLVTPGMFSI